MHIKRFLKEKYSITHPDDKSLQWALALILPTRYGIDFAAEHFVSYEKDKSTKKSVKVEK